MASWPTIRCSCCGVRESAESSDAPSWRGTPGGQLLCPPRAFSLALWRTVPFAKLPRDTTSHAQLCGLQPTLEHSVALASLIRAHP